MELYQVRCFLAVARTLSFSRAARECNVTQPAVSRAVRQLEYELGGDLIHREGRLTHLSDLGKLVLPMMEQAIAAADSACDQARQYKDEQVSAIRLGLAPSISASLMAEPLSRLARRFANLRIDLVERRSLHLVEALLEGLIHAAITGSNEKFPGRINRFRLFEERYVALVSRDHPFAQLREIPVRALRETAWLGREACEVKGLFERTCFGSDTSPNVVHWGGSESHLQHLAAAGLGALLAPEHFPRLPGLVALSIEGNPVRRHVDLLVVGGRRHTRVLGEFVKLARQYEWWRSHPAEEARVLDSWGQRQETVRTMAPDADGAGSRNGHRMTVQMGRYRSLVQSAG